MSLSHRLVLPLVLIAASAGAAAAQDAVARFEAASVAVNAALYDLTARENPALKGRLPDPSWDQPHRDAGTCILVAIAQQAGQPAMAGYIVGLEKVAARNHRSTADLLSALSFEVPGISGQAIQLISQACGMTDLQTARMQAALSN